MRSLLFALSNPVPGQEAEFNEWYDTRHVPESMAVPEVRAATRFVVADVDVVPGQKLDTHRYITVYEIDGETDEDFGRVGTTLLERFAGGQMTPTEAIDIASARVAFGRVVLPRQSKDDQAATVARSFLEGFGTWDDVFATIERWCADDCVWETPALPPAKGKDAMIAFAKGFQEQSTIARMECTFRTIAAAGDTVLTERVDNLWDADGNLITSLAVVGVLEVRDGRVVSFREYFDTAKGHV